MALPAPHLPCEIVMEIARLSTVRDMGALICVSHAFNTGTGPILYSSISVRIPAVSENRRHHPPHHVFACLLRPLLNPASAGRARNQLSFVKVLAYESTSVHYDYRCIPMIAEIIRFTRVLRDLRIRTPEESTPILLDIFQRNGFVIDSRRSFLDVAMGRGTPAENWLPFLQEVRAAEATLAIALMRHRDVHTVVIHRPLSVNEFNLLLPIEGPLRAHAVTRLSICVLGTVEAVYAGVRALAMGFRNVEHFALRTVPRCVPRVSSVRV